MLDPGQRVLPVAVGDGVGDDQAAVRRAVKAVVLHVAGKHRRVVAGAADDGIIAAAALHPVVAGIAREHVIALVALNQIIALTGLHRVIAAPGLQRIVAVAAKQLVAVSRALQRVGERRTLQVFKARNRVARRRAAGIARGDVDMNAAGRGGIIQEVAARPAGQAVGPRPAIHGVCAVTTVDDIGPGTALQRVIAAAARNGICPRPAGDAVRPGTRGDAGARGRGRRVDGVGPVAA